MKRMKLPYSSAKTLFKRTAQGSHPKNTRSRPMRGGIRL